MGKQLTVRGGQDMAKAKDVKAELAKYAKADSAREPAGGGGSFISLRGKDFTFKGDVLGDPLSVVILDYGFVNAYYDSDYDPDSPQPPACFAVSKTEDDLAPHDTSPKPQHDACKGCRHNEFGSADRGKGKACKNQRLLAVLNADVKTFDTKYVEGAEVAMLRLPPASLKHFKGYVKKLTEALQLPLFAAVTKLSFDEDEAHPVVTFEFGDEVPTDKKLLASLIAKREGVQGDLLTGYDTSNYGETSKKLSKKSPKDKPEKKHKPKF